ncbi:MAG: methionine adenosyltransferase [Clostridia bacterium]|nr:methionine adenosyltransferase [Clostridia bacterium]MBQ8446573.1 methionine adenosyltransferase [Clostridia bacterium]
MKKFFTSESVTEGHPDKVCDNISDGILDAILAQDPYARAAIECAAAFDTLLIMGEVTTTADVDYEEKAREIIKEIGYDFGTFAYDKCKIITAIHQQSPDIAMGVNASLETKTTGGDEADQLGAGDQGMMFGYACRETKELMPLTLSLSHRLAKRLTDVRKSGLLPYLRPDGKTQVTVEYVDGVAKRVDTVVVSTQHDAVVSQEQIRGDMKKFVIDEIVPANLMDENTKIYINPTGRFEIGGPEGDSGLTGRKIIVDTYGGRCAHGGGAFSGKDSTKVDRSAAYFCRYIAKNLVAAGLADEVEIQVAYAIGVAKPVSVFVDSHGTGKFSDERLVEIVKAEFDLRPYAIIRTLDLRKPVFKKTAAYGHFGYKGFAWEQLDRVDDLKKYL